MTAPTKTLLNKIKSGVEQAIQKSKDQNIDIILLCSFPFESDDLLPVLTHPADRDVTRIYWEQPSKEFTIAGLGAARVFNFCNSKDFHQINKEITSCMNNFVSCDEDNTTPFILGGHAFNLSAKPDKTWSNFPRGRFILPECLAVHENGSGKLIISRVVKPDDKQKSLFEEFYRTCIHYTNRLPVTLPPIQYIPVDKYRENPDWPSYKKTICSVLKKIKPGLVDKVVISRSHHVRVDGKFKAISALQVLRSTYHGCTSFMFSFPGEGIFFGSTPELLINKEGSLIKTEALAGTMGRGRNMEEDRLLMENLMDSHKEREEHTFVIDQIRRKLEPLVSILEVEDTPGILKLKNVHHLRTEIKGKLENGKNILDLIQQLHPTPAVAGTPTEKAMNIIRQYETHDRGWYSGPVGWIDKNGDGEFCVALRSALVNKEEAHVFAGGGIMAESVPENEWKESELKLMPVISALSGGQI